MDEIPITTSQLGPDGTARFGGLVEDRGDATHVSFETESGDYRASIPIDVACEQGVIYLHQDSLRLRVEDGATLCWNVKDVARARLTVGPEPDSVPENPPH